MKLTKVDPVSPVTSASKGRTPEGMPVLKSEEFLWILGIEERRDTVRKQYSQVAFPNQPLAKRGIIKSCLGSG